MKRQIILLYDYCRKLTLSSLQKLLFHRFNKLKDYHKILVVRKGTIGDHIVCQPIYQSIFNDFKNAHLHLLTSNAGHKYALMSDMIESKFFKKIHLFEAQSIFKLFTIIREEKYDLVIELPQDLDTLFTQIRNMFFYRLTGIKHGFGWQIGLSFLFKNYRFYNQRLEREFIKHSSNLVKNGVLEFIKENYISPEKTEIPFVANLDKYIAIAPGAKFNSKKWPYFKELIEMLLNDGFNILILGGGNETASFGTNVLDLRGKLSIKQSRYLLTMVKLLICNDSGPMHMAYSSGAPLIALFGGRSYPQAWWPPKSLKYKVMFKPIPKQKVAYILNHKMNSKTDVHLANIAAHEVYAEIKEMIKVI